jgi:hypothetical protein
MTTAGIFACYAITASVREVPLFEVFVFEMTEKWPG